MRNKGAIRILAIALALVSIYQLWFSVVTSMVESDAREFALGDQVLERKYLDSIMSEPVYNFLWLKDYTYRECKDREINLGLDLRGGMNVTLEVSVIDVIKSLSNKSKDPTFLAAIEKAKVYQQSSDEDFVTLFGKAFKEIDPSAQLAGIFATKDMQGRIEYNSTDEEVLKILKKETQDAIDNSFYVLRTRIDKFGVSQPNIQTLSTNGRILIELPGIKEPDRVRKLLQGTASLEFWETFENREVYKYLLDANKKIAEMQSGDDKSSSDTSVVSDTNKVVSDTNKVETIEDMPKVNSLDTTATPDSSLLGMLNSDTTQSLVDKLANDTTQVEGDQAGQFNKDYPLFTVLRPNVDQNGQLMKGASVGFAHFKDTSKVNEYLKMKQIKVLFPRDLKFYWTIKPFKDSPEYFQLVAIKVNNRDGNASLGGDVITDAQADFGQSSATAEVSMQMNGDGAKKWKLLTKNNIDRQIAIVLDGYVYSFPVVQGEIPNGRSSITGDFTVTEAKDLANVLKSGKLPAPAHIISEEVVGPSLGKEAIQAGMLSFLIAFIIVLIYMSFYYSRAGIVADIALIVNVFFIMGVLASLGAVLTLPGIAGIVLTIGMSVDANVLIYERIREEMVAGKGLKLAVSDGYKNAYSSIIDANVTTLLTGIVLFVFGSGPVQGFATTLIIGILTSLFSAIFITRLIFVWFLDRNKTVTFSTKITANVLKNAAFGFLQKRKIGYVISASIILIGVASLTIRGLNYGIDFKGGRSYVVRFDNDVSTAEVQSDLRKVFGGMPEVKTFGEDNQVKITTDFMIEEDSEDTDNIVEGKLFEGLKPLLGDISFEDFIENHRMSSQKVGPTIVDEIKFSAIIAIVFALVIIFLYILLRFKNWQYGFGALAAVVHDVLIVLGIFSLLYGVLPFSLEIDQAFIAAILTVVGYSINDTVIIFDRIREYIGQYSKRDRSEVINSALNSTLSRTLNTSLTTFVVLLAIFIFGGEVIRGFVFALMVGIVVGTYSSVFIAAPIVYDTVKKTDSESALKGKKKA